jgi:hypothetical protein
LSKPRRAMVPTQTAAEVATAFDAQVGLCGEGRIPARDADAQHADFGGVDVVAAEEVGHGRLDVFDALVRVLEVARLALRFALVGGVVGEAGEAGGGQDAGVVGWGLFLDGGPWAVNDYNCSGAIWWTRDRRIEERSEFEVAREEGDL